MEITVEEAQMTYFGAGRTSSQRGHLLHLGRSQAALACSTGEQHTCPHEPQLASLKAAREADTTYHPINAFLQKIKRVLQLER